MARELPPESTSVRDTAIAGVVLMLVSVFLLVAAPVGVLLGSNVLEMAVVALAGLGFALLHLTVVLALHLRGLGRDLRHRPTAQLVTIGGGGSAGGPGFAGAGVVGPGMGGGGSGGAGSAAVARPTEGRGR